MSAQTSYATNIRMALAGMLADLHNHDIVSRSVETAAGVDFGVAVSRGTDKDNQAVVGGATGFLGITVRSLDREGAANTGLTKYSEKETAAILRDGYIYTVCPTGCNPGDAVKYVDATGILDSGAATAGQTQLDDATWETTAAAGELAVIRIAGINTTVGA